MGKHTHIFLELLRKLVHLSGLSVVLVYTLILNFFSVGWANLALTASLLLLLEIEHVRIEHKPRIAKIFGALLRKHEEDAISGAAFFMISCLICFAVFNYWVAALAMFMTVFGDLFAALMGRAFGKTKIYNNKTLIGTSSGLAANLLIGILILPEFAIIVIPMALTATVTELITNKLDDNLTVPLFAGFIGQIIVKYTEITLPPLEFTIPGIL